MTATPSVGTVRCWVVGLKKRDRGEKGGGGGGGWRKERAGLAGVPSHLHCNMLKSLQARSKQADTDLRVLC